MTTDPADPGSGAPPEASNVVASAATDEASASGTAAEPAPRTDIYYRIRRAAPILVVLFCAGLLLLVAVVRPFGSPPAAIELRTPFVGADADPTAAYVIIHNSGGNDTLTGASTPAAASVEIQKREGVTESDPAGTLVTVDELEVPGFTDTRLQPGSDQLLLVGLTRPLAEGDTVELTLEFDRGGTQTVQAEVDTYLDIADQLLPSRLRIPGQEGVTPGQNGVTGNS